MTLGAEPKQLKYLAVLALAAVYSIYTNFFSEPDIPASARQSRTQSSKAVAPDSSSALNVPGDVQAQRRMEQRKQMIGGRQAVGEFRPTLKPTKENRPDPMQVDPTLRLDLLAKLQNVTMEGGHRSLFDFGQAPAPDVKPIIPGEKVIDPNARRLAKAMGPDPAPEPPKPTPKPAPPPIPLKFYGFTSQKANSGVKRAFFLEGEDIHVAGEGELIKRRYKIVKIGANSAVVEDTENKHQQTLPLEEPPVSG